MTATISIDPTSVRWKLLLDRGTERVPFFRTWMSRDVVFLAPFDVQRQIIKAWRDWYASGKAKDSAELCTHVDDWYL